MPLLLEALGSIVRFLLAFVAGYLVQHGVWTQWAADQYVAAAAAAVAMGLISLGWSLWQKYASHLKVLTALSMPAGSSVQQLQEKVDRGAGAKIVTVLLVAGLGASALATSGCAKVRPCLSATCTADEIVQRIDELQNAVIAANDLTPGAIPDTVAVPLVRFCVESAKVLKATPQGVLPAIAAEWRSVKGQIPAKYRSMPAVAAAYVAVDVALAEFGQ